MADIKKDQNRDELFRTIYKIATDLVHAGHVSEWDFKSYVLGTMFYRYISENFAAYINVGEHAAGNTDFDYAKMSDEEAESAREGLVQEKGFFILPSELFCNVRARADKDENLNETLERVFNHIESSAASGEAENDFAGLFDDFDVNSKSIGETVAKRNKVLAELLNGVEKMPLFSTDGINPDLFGDAYEYLMGMYAANAGKKGGQYFTPADVSELLARLGTIGKTRINKVYDPACGSGSLLLKVEKVLGKDNIEQGFFGQEIDLTTYNLCRINMFLHNIDFDKFSIVREDILLSPQHWDDQPFELIVSNPPYFVDALRCPDNQRCMARHTSELNYELLFGHSAYLLSEQGVISIIIPAEVERTVIDTAWKYNFHPHRRLHVFTKPGKPCRRVLLTFGRQSISCIEDSLYIEGEKHEQFTPEYIALTKDFYLKM